MPEVHVQIQWPDGHQEICYSPSLVIKDYLTAGETYALADFVERSRKALMIASERVRAKYGFPCSRALGQLKKIEVHSAQYANLQNSEVCIIQFLE